MSTNNVAALAFVVALATLLTACGRAGPATDITPGSAPPVATLLLDGTIPWTDEPADSSDFALQPHIRRTPSPGSRPCRASQLEASLAQWHPKGDRDDGETPSPARGLIGFVEVRNVSDAECSLSGEVPVRLWSNREELPLRYSHGANAEALGRTTAVPTGEKATLRLDWSAPFCGNPPGEQVVAIALPDDGGKLLAEVSTPAQPACTRSDVHPQLASVLSSGAFDEFRHGTTLDSPFNVVQVSVSGGSARVKAGTRIRYVVTIRNPGPRPIPLDPCPGYVEWLSAVGSAEVEAVTHREVRRLNCRTVHVLDGNSVLRFEMVSAAVPRAVARRELAVSWRLLARALSPTDSHAAGFTVSVD